MKLFKNKIFLKSMLTIALPIASIKALTETLADNIIQGEEIIAKYYGIILKESNNLQKLISDMLEMSRLQVEGMTFEKEDICSKALGKCCCDYIIADFKVGFYFFNQYFFKFF
ncbi:MAG: hypothetical protein SA378_09210 [Sedimentibacter sp.]|uniref:histidine kinase dimerization/phospho-acceptor domain-containing protein n=1 Tax=Sedimentibacter sp. TaxID=1960295 RepID=UPI0029825A8E|nr:histidine kinase dimerization/phospho-acceptor domain-containing protein [Sedimentibacter sp.]MDW5300301.1 hypothetical protein [Sedimentibacter sp.]